MAEHCAYFNICSARKLPLYPGKSIHSWCSDSSQYDNPNNCRNPLWQTCRVFYWFIRNPYQCNYHQFFINNVNAADIVLDIGCGNGFLTYELAEKVKHVTAIDIDKGSIEFARVNYNRDNINFIAGDATRYKFNERFERDLP